jgi:hypothetical protein
VYAHINHHKVAKDWSVTDVEQLLSAARAAGGDGGDKK